MGTVKLELTAQQYADVREAIAFLGKAMEINPTLNEESVLTFEELFDLDAALEAQCSQVELIKLLIAK